MSDEFTPHAPPRTFGRRLGRPMKGQRKNALEKLAQYGITTADLTTPARPLDPRAFFSTRPEKVWFEIGFGSGEHLLARMAQSPNDGFIGAEPYINGMAAFLKNLPDTPAPHVRVYMDDALHVISKLQDNALDGLYILNPDPWPKKRHHKRRIINPENIDLFARVLKPGGLLVFSTDVAELAQWTLEQMNAKQDFEITKQSAAAPHTPPPDWPLTTRYMAWGISEGRTPHFYIYVNKKEPGAAHLTPIKI